MPRYCFTLQVRPERATEYAERHRAVWPEMLEALARTGWHDYSLFLRGDGLLVGYVVADDLVAAQTAMAELEVNTRWQAEMAPFFVHLDGRAPDEGFELLTEVFHLEDQLTRGPLVGERPAERSPRQPLRRTHGRGPGTAGEVNRTYTDEKAEQ